MRNVVGEGTKRRRTTADSAAPRVPSLIRTEPKLRSDELQFFGFARQDAGHGHHRGAARDTADHAALVDEEVRRLIEAGPARSAAPWRPSGSVLVTGGTGALGVHVARWLLESGADRVVLASRGGRLVEELGDRVSVVACDVSDRAAVEGLVASIGDLSAVFHAAGVLDDGVIDGLTSERVAAVAVPKVGGLRALVAATAGRELSAFVVFSSVAGVIGSPGQANYAAANAYLDAWAVRRRAEGLPGLSVAWGPWAEAGMAVGTTAAARLRRGGVKPLDPALAVAALRQALEAGDDAVTVMDVDWDRFGPGAAAPLYAELPAAARATAPAPAAANTPWTMPEADRRRAVLALVRSQVALVLGHASGDDVSPRQAFKDLGFDSLTAVELRNVLAAATGLTLPSSLVFDYPTPEALAGHLTAALAPDGGTGADTTVTVTAGTDDPIAIVAMACRFPGGVSTPEQLWELLDGGVDGMRDFPADRGWDLDGASFTPVGGFVDDVAGFDAGLFGTTGDEDTEFPAEV